MSKIRKIYAADFGAGNTCMYTLNPDSDIREPADLIFHSGEPSGYALKANGNVVLGMELYKLEPDTDLEQLRINLKAQPTQDNQKVLTFYFKAWLDKLKRERPQEFEGIDEAYWMIGCPTGKDWKKKETRELYKELFERAGYENIFIIPESNAAMAYYQKKGRILESLPKDAQLLLIDQGAYSLDATYYHDGTLSSYGSYLGASLVERMMVSMFLHEEEEQIRMSRTMINIPETIDVVRERYFREGVGGRFHTYLLLAGRQLKENYFTKLHNGTLKEKKDLITSDVLITAEDGEDFRLFVNSSMMNAILEERSIKSVLGEEFALLAPEVQDEVASLSWMAAFRQFLDNLAKEYPQLGRGNNVRIMLTGGGSQMKCVGDAVKRRFPEALVYDDFDAVSAIGRGMAVWGPDKIKAMDFEKAFRAFVDKTQMDEDGDDVSLIGSKLTNAFNECTANLVKNIIAEEVEAVKYGFSQWLEYKCGSKEIPSRIDSHFRDWSRNTGLPSYKSDIMNHISTLKHELNEEFYQIMDDFGLERVELLKPDDKVFLSECSSIMPKLFDGIVDIIVSHYKENDIWDNIENGRKGLFSNPRMTFFNAVADKLNEWVDKETDGTIDLCKKVFYEHEFEIGDGDKYTFMSLFLYEAAIDLYNLMTSGVKAILGNLVLEEFIEDE